MKINLLLSLAIATLIVIAVILTINVNRKIDYADPNDFYDNGVVSIPFDK